MLSKFTKYCIAGSCVVSIIVALVVLAYYMKSKETYVNTFRNAVNNVHKQVNEFDEDYVKKVI